MSPTRALFAATAVVGASAALTFSGVAAADPASPPLPMPAQLPALPGLPGLPAMEQISPVIQQAASDPSGAVSLLMAAAAAFTGSSPAPQGSKEVADTLTQFLQAPAPSAPSTTPRGGDWPETLPGSGISLPEGADLTRDPAAHVPTAGSEPGAVAHLPSGVNPANAAGPVTHLPASAVGPGGAVGPGAHLPSGIDPANAVGPAPAAVPAVPAVTDTPDAVIAPVAAELPQAVPTPSAADTPPTQDFMYPSIGQGCLADGGNSIATALSVAGPAKIPTPGPGPGQTAYVFTAVGTPGPAETQRLPLNVTWVNLSTGRSGSATLKPHPDINPQGPTTLTAIVDTGSGSIVSTIFGQVTTKEHQCNFIPTIGSTVVP